MKLRSNIFKILIISFIITIIVPLTVNATSINLAIDQFRGQDSDGTYPAYALTEQHIYKVYEIKGDSSDYNKAIYCLDAGRGFGSNTKDWGLNKAKEYNQSLDMLKSSDQSTIKSYETSNNASFSEDDYAKVVRILKNIYIPGTTNREEFLKNMIEDYDEEDKYYITDKDIEVAQQLAIWYYTNEKTTTGTNTYGTFLGKTGIRELYASIYSNEGKTNLAEILTYVNSSLLDSEKFYDDSGHEYNELRNISEKYRTLYEQEDMVGVEIIPSDYRGMWNKFKGINSIYKKLLEIAESPDESIEDTTQKPLEIIEENPTIERSGDEYIIGPFKINKNNDNYYNFNVGLTDENKNPITEYTLLNESRETTTKKLEELVGEKFFIKIRRDVTFKKLKFSFTGKYDITSINYWTHATSVSTTQPVAIVERTSRDLSGEKEVTIPEKINIEVEKIWEDEENKDGIRPSNIKVQLKANGENYGAQIELNEANDWKYIWTNLEKSEKGEDITYTVEEVGKIEGYITTSKVEGRKTIITNTHEAEKTIREVEKIWEDEENKDGIRPSSIKVQLKANGVNYGEQIELNEANNWKYTWTDLEKNKEGKEIEYTIEEVGTVAGYIATSKVEEHKTTITNKHIPEKVQKEVEKIWEDEENKDGIRPSSIKVQLKANGENHGAQIELNEANNWKYTWTNLDKRKEGKDIIYTVEEVGEIDGYTMATRVEGNKTIITNIHIPVKPYDLALRKFISAVGNIEYDREPTVDFTKLIPNGTQKTARYEHTKTPVGVKVGNIVTYTIRIYNEGQLDAYVGKVTDYLPEELTFISELTPSSEEIKQATEFNAGYGWTIDTTTGQISTDILSKNTKLTSMQKEICDEQKRESALLKAFNGKKLDYIDLKVKCKVNDKAKSGQKITNIAEITKYEDENGNEVKEGNEVEKDRDSEPENFPDDKKNNDYEGNGEDRGYFPGQQDDDDFERLIIQQFDLALRKYISNIDGKDTSLRNPVPDTSKLNTKDEEGNLITTAQYNHIKTPITVVRGSVVTYTIRVYNEGDIDGYVNEITDYLPPELEYIEDSEINEKYGWKLSKDGRTVTTEYLMYKYGKTDNLLKAYDEKTKTLDYREVQIQCRVKQTAPYQKNITNLAQITEDCDEKGEEIEDRDSVPNDNFDLPKDQDLPKYKDDEIDKSYVPGQEDDDDFEKINVVYFDLALRKIVSKAIVIEETGQTITETNHKFEDDPEAIVKVDLGRKKLNKLTVKFEYQIRITNEGLIEGYAKEVKDYIPEGLEFKAEDNPLWKEISEGIITTDALKDTLLKPGESKILPVLLTWKNSQDNLGLKVNTAEISQDYNEYNTPDIDSTPDNKKTGEDDIDDAPVMLSIALGNTRTYFGLTLLMLITVAGGVYLIKKYVV